jgi:predicted house-cleaning noncanonical NTP pyrophosphatase (MazG superfamily)
MKGKEIKKDGKDKKEKNKSSKKLVRDKIPGIIKKKGAKPVIKIADEDEYIFALKHKILEEADALTKARGENGELEEIIDIMEAVNAFIKHKKISVKAAERMRKYKLRKRGGFEKRFLLEGVEEK